jgi:hypothetical protein
LKGVLFECPWQRRHFLKFALFESSAKLSVFCYSTGLKESEDADADSGGRIAVLKGQNNSTTRL